MIDKIDSITIQNTNSFYPWIEISIKHTEIKADGIDRQDRNEKIYKHREQELENFKQKLLTELQLRNMIEEWKVKFDEFTKFSPNWTDQLLSDELQKILNGATK